jgi:hypothetical protein
LLLIDFRGIALIERQIDFIDEIIKNGFAVLIQFGLPILILIILIFLIMKESKKKR